MFSWVIFGAVFGICLAIGFPIVSYTSPLPLEFRNNTITLISLSLLLSIAFGGRVFVQKICAQVWMPIAKWIAWKYIEKRIKEYGTEIPVSGLKNNSGTVNLILEAGASDGVSPGMILDVLTKPGGEKYGEVQVIQLSTDVCVALPTNRVNVEFWEKLEDRMKTDPSPPANIAAKLQIPNGLVETLRHLL